MKDTNIIEEIEAQNAKALAEMQERTSPLQTAFDRAQVASIAASELRKEFIALLPEATQAHMAVIVKHTEDGTQIPDEYVPNKMVRLSAVQQETVKQAAGRRVAFLTANKAEMVDECVRDGGDLTGYTIRVGSKKTVRKLTFTLTHDKEAKGKGTSTKAASIIANFDSIAKGS